MQARRLRKLLNDTGYYPNNNDDYIALGSPYCHDLISVDKKTLKVKYALDTFHKGRESLGNDELKFIWDKLHELIASGEINDIINGSDTIENPIPVYYTRGGKLIEGFTDKIEWPNTDLDGYTIYQNSHFANREDAIKYAIRDCGYGIKNALEQIAEREKDLEKAKGYLKREEDELKYFENLLNPA